jgi:hypothetical protein
VNADSEYRSLVSLAANQAEALAKNNAAAGRFEPLYLYCRPSAPGKAGCLMFFSDSDTVLPEFELVIGEGLRGNVPYSNYWQWVYDRARRSPILAI